MGKRGREDSSDEGHHTHKKDKSHKKDKKEKKHRDKSPARSPAAAQPSPAPPAGDAKPAAAGDEAERKRKRLEAWKAMQSSVQTKPAEPAPVPVPVPKAAGSGGAFKMGMKSKFGASKLKPAASSLFATQEAEPPKLGGLPPLGRQASAATSIGGFSPPSSPAPGTPPGMSDLDDDVDPLDAFMTGISKEVQESIGDCLPLAGPSALRQKEQREEQSKLQTITMEDIMKSDGGAPGEVEEEEEDDKLDEDREAFMAAIRQDREEKERKELEEKQRLEDAEKKQKARAKREGKTGRFLDDEAEEEYWVDIEEEEAKYLEKLAKKKLAKELPPVDHDKIEYMPFQRKFYAEAGEIKKMTDEQVSEYRKELDSIRIRGRDCPRPIRKWTQCGLPGALLTVLSKNGFEAPFAIQCQALPAIMSGRDVIGVAKTGSGKTLAFVIPMLRHIKAQPPLADGEGPIGLIMAPTRELATQIFRDTKQFTKSLNLTPVCAYGGAPMAQQVGDIKAGAEIVVCTPGRCIDLLTINGGRVMNLQRTTYVVLDEADRMFDMGFEPQVQKIIKNVRPDRQTVMFSATFPKVVEKHAKSILENPLQIVCGGVSVVSNTISQNIEVVGAEAKSKRLLELLSQWYNLGDNILVFVDRQEDADELFRDLIKAGYVALTLHGGKDQNDRDHTLADFKNKDNTLMIATSVAARGLDVKDLTLVVNYDCPNHYEDYVHRVGRTGRAGKKGTAYTFIEPEEDAYAPDMVRALELAGVEEIPPMLQALAEQYGSKEKAAYSMGQTLKRASGFTSGKGFKFDEAEGKAAKDKLTQAKAAAGAEVKLNTYYDSDEEESLRSKPDEKPVAVAAAQMAPVGGVPQVPFTAWACTDSCVQVDKNVALQAAMEAAKALEAAKAMKAAIATAVAKPNAEPGAAEAAEPAAASAKPAAVASASSSAADMIAKAQAAAAAITQQNTQPAGGPTDVATQIAIAKAKAAQLNIAAQAKANVAAAQMQAMMGGAGAQTGLAAAQAVARQLSMRAGQLQPGMSLNAQGVVETSSHAQVELEINDYPQQARWKVTHRSTMDMLTDEYQICITTRGSYFAPGRNPPAGERKLYLTIEGADENNVIRAKRELRRMLEEAAAGVRDVGTAGRYNV